MPGGRRTKLTRERIERICEQVRKGVPYETAARLAGIDPSTFYRWKRRGEQAKRGLYREFWEALQQADAEAEATLIEETKKEKGGPRWILERRWPERWGQRVDVKWSGEPLQRVVFDLSQIPEDDLRRFLQVVLDADS